MKNSERGALLLEVLVALAIFAALIAMTAQSIPSIFQAANEKNAVAGVQSLMTAEASYQAAFNSYATDSNLHYLSDCPAPVTQNGKTMVTPTATAACLPVSTAYTNGSGPVYQYNFSVVSTVGPDGIAATSDDGYVITSTPVNKSAGRVTYCSENRDGLLRGQVEGTTPATAAECDAMPTVAAGTATATTQQTVPVVLTTGLVSGTVNTTNVSGMQQATLPITLTGIPAGTYLVSGHIYGYQQSNSGNVILNGTCTLTPGGSLTPLDVATFSAPSQSFNQNSLAPTSSNGPGSQSMNMWWATFNTTVSGSMTLSAPGSVSLSCKAYDFINNPITYSGTLTAMSAVH